MRENDNHPLTNGTYDWGDGFVEPVDNREHIAEVQEMLANVLETGESGVSWVSFEDACVDLIQQIRQLNAPAAYRATF